VCAPHDLLARLGDKWTILTMGLLSLAPGNRLRFSEIKAGVEGISQRMLTLTLRSLERDGLVLRHVFAEVPPRVEYELTDMGRSMLPSLEGFTGWMHANWPEIEKARKTYDIRTASTS
jgi:DNA-binding HxlR family transcriptional regulator